MTMLEEELGSDFEIPEPEYVLTGRSELEEIAMKWALAAESVIGDGRGALVVGKIARILCNEEYEDPELHACDTAPNLMLLEVVLGQMRAELARRRPDQIDRLGDRLCELLRPRLAAVADEDRTVIATLCTAGLAPSPFADAQGSRAAGRS